MLHEGHGRGNLTMVSSRLFSFVTGYSLENFGFCLLFFLSLYLSLHSCSLPLKSTVVICYIFLCAAPSVSQIRWQIANAALFKVTLFSHAIYVCFCLSPLYYVSFYLSLFSICLLTILHLSCTVHALIFLVLSSI
jgi:hypothetical protein